MKTSKSRIFTIVGLIVAALGVLGPIAWDYYKTTAEIELRVSKENVIIDHPQHLESLLITYGGEPIEVLSKTTVTVVNTGRVPVLGKDVVQPIRLAFLGDSVIDVKIEIVEPANLSALADFDKKKGVFELAFPLLNPGDRIALGILAKSREIEFEATARIAGIRSIVVVEEPDREPPIDKKVPWTVYPVGIFSALLFFVAVVALKDAKAEIRMKSRMRSGAFSIPEMTSRAECRKWVNSEFSFTTNNERLVMLTVIDFLPESENFSREHEEVLRAEAEKLVKKALSNPLMIFIVTVIAVAGASYVYSIV